MKYIVSISGGKDSTATLLKVLEFAPKNDIEVVFCDTKWEADKEEFIVFEGVRGE